jgi:hypothetical protein
MIPTMRIGDSSIEVERAAHARSSGGILGERSAALKRFVRRHLVAPVALVHGVFQFCEAFDQNADHRITTRCLLFMALLIPQKNSGSQHVSDRAPAAAGGGRRRLLEPHPQRTEAAKAKRQ